MHTSFFGRRLRLVVVFVFSLTFIATTLVTATAEPSTANENEPILFGAHPSQRGDETRPEAAANLQETLGRDLGIVRRYFRWEDSAIGDPLVDWTVAEGAIPHISVLPQRADGEIIPWADLAAAEPGSTIDTELRTWAAEISALGVPVWFTFNHEPETTHNLAYGSDEEFVAAWRRVVDVFEEEGVDNVEHLWVMTAFSFSQPEQDRRFAEKWYPGDEWVDHIGADPYNWTDCRHDVTTPWRTFETLMDPVREFAALHPDKGLVAAEFGSAEDPEDSGRKAEWVNEIRRLLREPEWSQVNALIAFNAQHPDPQDPCEWWADSTPESLAAYQGLIDDLLFGGDGPPPPPPREVAPLTCNATVVGDTVELLWDETEGRNVVRRNDSYLASAGDGSTSYVDSEPNLAVNDYSIRVWIDDLFTDVDCGTIDLTEDEPEAPCSVDAEGTEVTVSWEATDAREILRQNDAWLASPSADSVSYTHTANIGAHTYQLRTWLPGGQFADVECGSVTIDADAGPSCSVTLEGTDATVTWDGFSGREIVRRNNSWRNSPADDVSSFTDTNLSPGDYDYSLRVWQAGVPIDTDCGSVTVA